MSTEAAKPHAPDTARLTELANVVLDEHAVLGPLDREDLERAIAELLDRRAQQAELERTAPDVQAA
ncbi:MAG: hypothetical protein ACREUG_04185 [Steroidobacteraceae bacterium]